MNKKVLRKALDELNKPEPKIDYVRGILETLLDADPEIPKMEVKLPPPITNVNPHGMPDELDNAMKVLGN